jgi:hypothetical protein
MRQAVCTTAAAASVLGLVLADVAFGSTSGSQRMRASSLIAIREQGNPSFSAGNALKGRFVLLLNGVMYDSGTTSIHPNNGQAKIVDGQTQYPIYAFDVLTSKKGTLSFNIRGIDIPVNNIDGTKRASDNESGTWKITRGTGIYKGWSGGGRWASVGTASGNTIEWVGHVTH